MKYNVAYQKKNYYQLRCRIRYDDPLYEEIEKIENKNKFIYEAIKLKLEADKKNER